MNDEINYFVLVHLFAVYISYEEADVIALDRNASQNHEILSPHHHESGEFVCENFFQVVDLLDRYAYSHAVYTRFDQNFFLIVATNDNGSE